MIKLMKENDYSETDEFTLIKEMNHWINYLKKFFVDDRKAQKVIADYFYYDDGAHQEDFKELQTTVKTLRNLWKKLDAIVEEAEEKEYKEKNKKESVYKMQESKNYDVADNLYKDPMKQALADYLVDTIIDDGVNAANIQDADKYLEDKGFYVDFQFDSIPGEWEAFEKYIKVLVDGWCKDIITYDKDENGKYIRKESVTRSTKETKNMEDDLRGIYVDDVLSEIDDELKREGFELIDDDQCLSPKDCRYSEYTDGKYEVLVYYTEDDSVVRAVYVTESLNESHKRLSEQDTKIEVKHEGILEVPEGKKVDELPISHFVKLAKKKGLSKITKALNNLQVWNKNDDPELSKWAGDMIDKVSKRMEKKNESLESDDIYIPEDVKVLRNRLSDLGYRCGDPFSFYGKTMSSCVKFYPIGEDETGLEIEIDPYSGEYKATHYYYDSDDDYADEDVSEFCDVRKVRTVRDIDNIERWAKETVRRNSL